MSDPIATTTAEPITNPAAVPPSARNTVAPSHLSLAGTITYVAVMAFGMVVIIGTPFLLHRGPASRGRASG